MSLAPCGYHLISADESSKVAEPETRRRGASRSTLYNVSCSRHSERSEECALG